MTLYSIAIVFLLSLFLRSPGFAEEPIDFSRDIRPILNAHCTACHGGVKKSGAVSFLYREQVISNGKSGKPIVVPGDPGGSEMMTRILSNDPDELMPQPDHGRRLNDKEVSLIRRWIKEGASWNNHWSLEAPTRHKLPSVKNTAWPKNAIDRFILARLEKEELTPAKPAIAGRLLRRLHLDLIGLPPTLEELDAFEDSHSSNPDAAVQSVITDLLARPAFGEKWATQWLDLARYADSEGLGADRRWNVWPYRDWVIRSLNQDLPYDEFIKKQIAGDLLPEPSFDDLIATTFHRLTQQNAEGGTDNEEFRVMAVMDRVNTTWTALQGITFECIQCHDHPYEPIRHDEYYKFMAFFNSTRDLDHNNHHPTLRVPAKSEDFPKAFTLKERYEATAKKILSDSQAEIKKAPWTKVSKMKVRAERVGSKTRTQDGYLEFLTDGTIPRNVLFHLDIPKPEHLETLTAFRIHTLPLDLEKSTHTGSLGAVLSHVILRITTPGDGGHREVPLQRVLSDDFIDFHWPQHSLSNNGAGWGARTHQFKPRSAVFVLKEPLALPEGAKLNIIIHHKDNAPTGPLTTKRGRLDLTDSAELHRWVSSPETQARFKAENQLLNDYRKLGPTSLPTMQELPSHLSRATHTFVRGNWLEKDTEALPAATPTSLHPLGVEKNANRLDLANWLTSAENPFTSRVLVSRVWEQIFGLGLVETMEDFGSSGLAPSHPELLDDLAVRFQTEMNYSIKTLIREVLSSATYRQSAKRDSLSGQKDPRNRLLSRGPRNRLSAEHIRDHHLTASGLLTEKLYGSPVRPPIPDGIWKPFNDGPWNAAKIGDPNRYRRSIYTYRKRSIPHPTADAFDSPTRENCAARRLTSNTPLGALVTLNDEGFAEMAGALARRMKYETEGDVETKIITGFRLATSIKPSERQLQILNDLFEKISKDYTENPSQYDGLAGSPDGAAYTVVASAMLNMDDALTR
ncbi:MAG: PSD1 and planctomycete cytochrome C domain-containing protein [Akkermansiaceae bacterium]